ALPEGVQQFLVPPHVPGLVGQVQAMGLDELGLQRFAMREEGPAVEEGPLLLQKHQPQEGGEEEGLMGGPLRHRLPEGRNLNEMEIPSGVKLRSAPQVEPPEHGGVAPLFLLKPFQPLGQPLRPGLALQRCQDLSESRLEIEDLLVEIERLKLVVPPP